MRPVEVPTYSIPDADDADVVILLKLRDVYTLLPSPSSPRLRLLRHRERSQTRI
jgi:hypothetical protein